MRSTHPRRPPGSLPLLVAALVSVSGAAALIAQREPVVEILAPADGSYVSGPVTLDARVEPSRAVGSLVFYADGRVICTLTAAPFTCDWNAGPTVVEHQVRLVVNLTDGRRLVRTVRTKGAGYTETVSVDAVQVTATVTDGSGHYVRGLSTSVFHVFEDDREQPITAFASENVPLELLAAVDISGSMSEAMPKLKAAVKEFLAAIPEKDAVTLVGFNDSLFTVARRTLAPADRAKAVDRLASWGGTALYDAIVYGIDALDRWSGRKVLVVFTDGEDRSSHVSLEETDRRLQASDVVLYLIGQGHGASLEPLKKTMRRLTAATGGRALFTGKIDELRGAFQELLLELSNQYLLGYAPTGGRAGGSMHRLRVTVDGDYHVRARQGYRVEPGR